jgi:hypothetical protein
VTLSYLLDERERAKVALGARCNRARSLVRWCDGEQSKIRMHECGVKISGRKIGNSGNRGGNSGLTRTGRRRQSRRYGGRRPGPSAPIGRPHAAGFVAARPAVCTFVAMAYDEELAGRIRQLIGSDPELTEKKMFGGLAFLIRGNMAIAASGQGGAMVRADPAVGHSGGDDEGHASEHARPRHARLATGQLRRSPRRRPAGPLG